MTLGDLVTRFTLEERPNSIMLDESVVLAQLVAAVEFYAGYAALDGLDEGAIVDADTPLTLSELALIKPLFLLHIERETALQMEASRTSGVEPFGRTSSEAEAEITAYHAILPGKAFTRPIVTI